MFCTNSNLCVNLNSKIIGQVTTIYIYKLLGCIQWQLMWPWYNPTWPQPHSNGPSFLMAFHFEINLISTSGLDLTHGPYFFYVAIYVTACFLSLAIYMYRLVVLITLCIEQFLFCVNFICMSVRYFSYNNLNLICVATHIYNRLYFVTYFLYNNL